MESNRIVNEKKRINNKHLENMEERANRYKCHQISAESQIKLQLVMNFPGLLPTSGRLSSLYMPLQLLGIYLKIKIGKYCLILYEHVISLYVVLFPNRD